MPCRARPQFRRGRLPRSVRALTLLRRDSPQPTAELWRVLIEVEPALTLSGARAMLHALERRRYLDGETHERPGPGGQERRWELTDLGRRVLARYEQLAPRSSI